MSMTSRAYCHDCSVKLEVIQIVIPEPLIGNQYQRGKFNKHTLPTAQFNLISVFDTPSSDDYRGFIELAAFSGSAFVDDDMNRKNMLFSAGSPIGLKIFEGKLYTLADTILVACADDPDRIHAFPVPSGDFGTVSCENCGKPIFRPNGSS